MQRVRRYAVAAAVLLCFCLSGFAVLSAQPPQPPTGFVPADSLPAQEQMPAAPLVIAAYSIVWALVCIYVWSVWRRIQRAERDLAEVRRQIPAGDRR